MNKICVMCGKEPKAEFKGITLCADCYRAYRAGWYDAMYKIRRFTQGMLERDE